MSLPVVLSPEAQEDFDSAADWYQQQAVLGARFTANVREALQRIGLMPDLHAIIRSDIRRAKIRTYPYNIYFRIRTDRVEVIAVLLGRRDPSVWKGRA